MISEEQETRFWSKVDKSGSCWLWTGSKTSWEYGQHTVDGKNWRVHRLAYILTKGEIPKGLHLDHLCRVRHCVNPDHLEPVTNKQNVLRGIGPTANNARKTHCKRGHEFTEANTYVYTRGEHQERFCKACHNLTRKVRDKKYKDKLRATKLAKETE